VPYSENVKKHAVSRSVHNNVVADKNAFMRVQKYAENIFSSFINGEKYHFTEKNAE